MHSSQLTPKLDYAETTYLDRSEWDKGPWDTEPDLMFWRDALTGYAMFIYRNSIIGNLCGYVGVDENHPFYGQSLDELERTIHAHQGITFADAIKGFEILKGKPEKLWWIGFHCCYGTDLVPKFASFMQEGGKGWKYCDRAYVEGQIYYLAGQIKSFENATQTGMVTTTPN